MKTIVCIGGPMAGHVTAHPDFRITPPSSMHFNLLTNPASKRSNFRMTQDTPPSVLPDMIEYRTYKLVSGNTAHWVTVPANFPPEGIIKELLEVYVEHKAF